ncbi:hypothetical protein [Streptomyces sp. PSKA30]|uniref:hypothetical protein n=1 Tax=Streptomyces sp. PSKA30 TaxID=2874597 RepID=UPI001CD06321|nr:hypothetical protein [Streptomyces sp. PSKA30]MBZ9642321.1 hypothetical protein [Streptomyces sp. PSKA30]
MLRRLMCCGVALSAVLAGPAWGAEGGGQPPPDPTPGGPERPYERDVAGPRNVDSLSVAVTGDGGDGVRVAFDRTSRAEPAGPPAAPRRFVFLFDESLRFHPDDFPVCARSTIEQAGTAACPEGSQVGRGTSHLYPEGTADVYAFNTRHANGLRGALVVIPASDTILELTWEKVTKPYRDRGYRWALDEIVPPTPVPPEQRVGTRRFELAWGATHGPASFATLTGAKHEKLRFGLWSEFVTGQVILPETTSGIMNR